MLVYLGKSETLTGRTTIWQLAIDAVNLQPLLGHGMGGFWETSQAQILRAYADWAVPHAHNGFLEVALQIGWVGTALVTLVLLQVACAAKRIYKDRTLRFELWPSLFLLTVLIYGAVEANYLRPNSFVQLFMYLIIAYGAGSSQALHPRIESDLRDVHRT